MKYIEGKMYRTTYDYLWLYKSDGKPVSEYDIIFIIKKGIHIPSLELIRANQEAKFMLVLSSAGKIGYVCEQLCEQNEGMLVRVPDLG